MALNHTLHSPAHLLVLIGGDANELGLLEDVRPERGVGQLDDVIGSDEVKSRLVLVHRVQDGLQKEERGPL